MADYTVEISLSDHKRGDRWPGITSIGPILINGAQPTDLLERIRMQFRHEDGRQVFRLDSDAGESPDAPITISNATTWAALVPPIQSFLRKAGEWAWDMEFYDDANTLPRTLYKGTLTVIDDTTK